MRMLAVITLGMLSCYSSITFAEIYKWTDEEGRIHFSDRPDEANQAEKVNVRINSYENVTIEDTNLLDYINEKKPVPRGVVMYATSWCGYCKKARNYFRKNSIAFTEYNIEENREAKKAYDELGGRGVPVILVGEKRMNGFSEAGFNRIYKAKN